MANIYAILRSAAIQCITILALTATIHAQTPQTVFAEKSTWKYFDSGNVNDSTWASPTFNDNAWKQGSGVFGYGNGDEQTLLDFGTASNKHSTTYFRKTIAVSGLSNFQNVRFELMRDDAAVVYINGIEVHRNNISSGAITYTSTALAAIENEEENRWFIINFPTSLLQEGNNTIAVAIYKVNAIEPDLRFDAKLQLETDAITPTSAVFTSVGKVGNFTSVQPGVRASTLSLPDNFTFQEIARQGLTTYANSTRVMPGNHDFTGYIGLNQSSTEGVVSINHETSPGDVSLVNVNLNPLTQVWQITNKRLVDFNSVGGTGRNCSGGVTPWGTVVTSEETTSPFALLSHKVLGWQVEIDPFTGNIVDQDGDTEPDKIFAMGNMSHENFVVNAEGTIAYQAEDGGTSCIYKYVLDTPQKLGSGKLFVLQRTGTSANGVWIEVPNGTITQRNSVSSTAGSIGGTNWTNPEDVELSPDGKVYFTSKGTGTIWRFKDNGSTVSEIEAWVTNRAYPIITATGVVNENFGTGIDNLAFDDEGNCWAQQDGGQGHLWVIRPDHSNAKPKVELFARTPAGSESTGLTFTPDFKYAFFSIQHPAASNGADGAKLDAAGNNIQFNQANTVVIALKEKLGTAASKAPVFAIAQPGTTCQGEQVILSAPAQNNVEYVWSTGQAGNQINVSQAGWYVATAYSTNGKTFTDSVLVLQTVVPEIKLGNDTTLCATCTLSLQAPAGFAGYLWNTGATTASILVNGPGLYSVLATSNEGCTASDSIQVNELVGIGETAFGSDKVSIMPNPVKEVAVININASRDAELSISLLDLQGKAIGYNKQVSVQTGTNSFSINLKEVGISAGQYLLLLKNELHTASLKLVVE